MVASGGQVRVAVIGAGIMGSAMARRLLLAGLPVTVWDRSVSARASLAEAGAVGAESAREAVADAGVVITMLPTADVVRSRMGIGHQQLEQVIEGGPLDAPIADAKLHKMDQSDFAPEFPWNGRPGHQRRSRR